MTHDFVQQAFHAFAGGDPDRISAVLTEDAEWLSPPGNATAVALDRTNHMVGKAAISRFFTEDFPRLFARDLTVTVHRLHADDRSATVEATITANLVNGNHYANDYCFVIELRDGLVHRVREYVDTARGNRMVFAESHAENQEDAADTG
ncbi:nuclear transport factor 2 family protein [Sciscionella marina]|uniref:nuclear transport factor 2 family protein n=1 Tax=Sciscionella marina TaxID=508770 RepID=UPI00037263B7|nr:nuclear transport factor 2 family protein [Sciscionella marina]